MLAENDDAAELSSRRKSIIDRRKSMGLSRLAQLSENQMEEQMKQCIQLNTENKINIKNAFKINIIDLLTCMVTRDGSNLQMASSSLDVSSKIYGLRVDQVHAEVTKSLVSMGEKRAAQEMEDDQENQEDQTEEQQVKKKRRRKRGSVLCSAESLKGTIELVSESSLIHDGDPQTSDVLCQVTMPLATDNIYFKNRLRAIDEIPVSDSKIKVEFKDLRPKRAALERLDLCSATKGFSFRKWTVEDEEVREEFEEQGPMDRSVFQFDLDASVGGAQFAEDEPERFEIAEFLSKNVAAGVNVDFSEYSFVPTHEIMNWKGGSHWKIRLSCRNTMPVGTCANKRTKRKVQALEFNDETIEEVTKLLKPSKGGHLSSKVMSAWSEDKLLLTDDVFNSSKSQLGSYFLRPEGNVRTVQLNELNTTRLENNGAEIYDYNNVLDTSEYCPDIDQDNDEGLESQPENEAGVFVGDNLVEVPDLVGDTFIPYSRRAKKIDVQQLKQSIWKTLKSKVEKKEEPVIKAKEFSEMYQELPKLLNKANQEALSVPVCFVSLLHLANEKVLRIEESEDRSNLIVNKD